MSDYRQHKQDVGQWLDQLRAAIDQLEPCQLLDSAQISQWRRHLEHALKSLGEPLLRVAVVGAVKSGKSTLINALLGRDLLKRGAGITTAFITRILTDEQLGGWIELKSWPQISRELNDLLRTLTLSYEFDRDGAPLDVRNDRDFEHLRRIRESIQARFAAGAVSMDPNFIQLDAYLGGHTLIRDHLADVAVRIPLPESKIAEHQRYVGQESLATYLQDIELHAPVSWLGDHIEIADCQGSDSPNPLHFAALQRYLLGSHFIVYVISGHTGLREADYRLLNFIRSLRMFPQTIFALNVDLDLHAQVDDLNQLSQRVFTELSWFAPKPRYFVLSALQHLVEQMGEEASPPELRRLQSWRALGGLAAVTANGVAAFREALAGNVDGHRQQVLMDNAINRAALLAGSIADSTVMLRRILTEDQETIARAARTLQERRKVFATTIHTLQQAIQGTHDDLRVELDRIADQAFDLSSGTLVLETLALIDRFAITAELGRALSSTAQVVQGIHSFYLRFRQDLWAALVEQINGKIVEFAKAREEWLGGRLSSAAEAFWSLYLRALEDYRRDLTAIRLPAQLTASPPAPPRLELKGNSPPQFSAFIQRTPLTRPVLLVKFGLGRLSQWLVDLQSRLGRQPPQGARALRTASLDEALALVKSETRTELLLAFRDYLRVFKRDYLCRLLDSACHDLLEEFQSRAELAQISLADAIEHGAHHQDQQRSLLDRLGAVHADADRVLGAMRSVRPDAGELT